MNLHHHPKLNKLYQKQFNGELIVNQNTVIKILEEELSKIDIEENSNKKKNELNQQNLAWIQTLYELNFILRFDLFEFDKIQDIFNDRTSYEKCIQEFRKKIISFLEKEKTKRKRFVNRVFRYRFMLDNSFPNFIYLEGNVIDQSLLQLALKQLDIIPYQIRSDFSDIEKRELSKIEISKNEFIDVFTELSDLINNKKIPTLVKAKFILSNFIGYIQKQNYSAKGVICEKAIKQVENYLFVNAHFKEKIVLREAELLNDEKLNSVFNKYIKSIQTEVAKRTNYVDRLNFFVKELSLNKDLIASKNLFKGDITTLPKMAVVFIDNIIENSDLLKKNSEEVKQFEPLRKDRQGYEGKVTYDDIKEKERFADFELNLYEFEYIDENYNFKGEKIKLAAIYQILIDNQYFKKRNHIYGNFGRTDFRKYLDSRYNTNTSKEFQPNRLNPEYIKKLKNLYLWIDKLTIP